MKLLRTIHFAAAAFLLSLAPLGAAVVFNDSFSGNPEESLADYNANYTISTSNVNTWSEGIASSGQGAFFSQVSNGGGNGLITADNSADYTNTTFADSRYLYATGNFFIADASEFTNDGAQLGVTITFQDHQNVRFGIRNDGGQLFAFAQTVGRSIANIAPYTAGTEMIVAIRYDGEGTGWKTRPAFGQVNPGMTEPSDWGTELVDQSNSSVTHTTTDVTVGLYWGPSFTTAYEVAGTISNVLVGTTYADVAQVPEPATYTLISGMLALGFILWRRRR